MKKIEVYNNQTGEYLETWNYEDTKKRLAKTVSKFSPRKEKFNDQDLLDVLEHYNSFCMFHIEE